jgi:transcriptional regulator with XRE-family HTH domain
MSSVVAGLPVLTPVGKRVEVLRIGRGLSKQHLARSVGISRQQLWRVMTGKSELTSSLRVRLADALGVDPAELADDSSFAQGVARSATPSSLRLASYLANATAIALTLETLPRDEGGRVLKRELLNAIEDQAMTRGHPLGIAFFDLRRRVIAGDL